MSPRWLASPPATASWTAAIESQAVAIGNLGPVDPDTGAEDLTALLLAARLSKEDEPKAIAPPSPEAVASEAAIQRERHADGAQRRLGIDVARYGRCNVCGKTFSQNLKAIARQKEPHKNKAIFKLLVNKMPVRRIIEVTDIDPQTFYNRLDFLHRQCQLFAAHRERGLANLPIRRLYLGIDRQDYLVNWLGCKDKRNTWLSAIAVVDATTSRARSPPPRSAWAGCTEASQD
jgi:transposase-like protein